MVFTHSDCYLRILEFLEKELLVTILNCYVTIHTIKPGYGDALKEDQEQQAHPTGRVVVKEFEYVDSTLVTMKRINVIPPNVGYIFNLMQENKIKLHRILN